MNATTDLGVGDPVSHTSDLRYCAANAASGDYVEFDPSLNGQTINLGSQIQITQNNLSIIGQDTGGDPVNVTVNGQANTRLFEILGTASINDLTLTGGYCGGNGGAVLVDPGPVLYAIGDSFLGNAAGGNGGAIENDGTAGLWSSTFTSNGSGGRGGAVENTGVLTLAPIGPLGEPLSGSPSVFTSNSAVVSGGAIDSSGGGRGELSVYDSDFYGDTAGDGGAVATADPTDLESDTFGGPGEGNGATTTGGGDGGAVYATAPASSFVATLTANNCTFADNTAAGAGWGGAIYTTMNTSVQGGTFESNSAAGSGGAIESVGGSSQGLGGSGSSLNPGGMPGGGPGAGLYMTRTLTVIGSTFDQDTSTGGNGGAIDTSNPTTLSNDTFTDDQAVSAGGNGGAVDALQNANAMMAQLDVSNCTFDSDQAGGSGGAICTNMGADVENSTLDNNSAGSNGGAIDYGDLSDMVTSSAGGSVTQLPTVSSGSSANASMAAAAPVNRRYTPTGPFRLNNDTLSNNFTGGDGGAINSHGNGAGNLVVTNVQFTKCSAQNGGAIATNDPTSLTSDTFGDPTGDPAGLRGNTATINGGAIYALPGGRINPSILRVSQCTFVFSSAGKSGGAIFTDTTAQVQNSIFQNGKAPVSGGAIDASLSNAGMAVAAAQTFSLTLSRDLFEYNSSQYGGAVADYMDNEVRGAFSTNVDNCTFDNNTAVGQNLSPGTPPLDSGKGGGLYVEATSNATGFLEAVSKLARSASDGLEQPVACAPG